MAYLYALRRRKRRRHPWRQRGRVLGHPLSMVHIQKPRLLRQRMCDSDHCEYCCNHNYRGRTCYSYSNPTGRISVCTTECIIVPDYNMESPNDVASSCFQAYAQNEYKFNLNITPLVTKCGIVQVECSPFCKPIENTRLVRIHHGRPAAGHREHMCRGVIPTRSGFCGVYLQKEGKQS